MECHEIKIDVRTDADKPQINFLFYHRKILTKLFFYDNYIKNANLKKFYDEINLFLVSYILSHRRNELR